MCHLLDLLALALHFVHSMTPRGRHLPTSSYTFKVCVALETQ